MTPDERTRLTEAFTRDDEDIEALSDVLYLNKVRVYTDTLAELADHFDYEYGDVQLSQEILEALRGESDLRAEQITATFNSEVAAFVSEVPDDVDYGEAVEGVAAWAEARDEERAQLVAITEAYSPHADATLAFFLNNDLTPDFDFGGHGDDAPACVVCQALVAGNPHAAERVVEIGTPHIQCRQSWHPRVTADDLPDDLVLGEGSPAGILGNESLVNRAGGHSPAAEEAASG